MSQVQPTDHTVQTPRARTLPSRLLTVLLVIVAVAVLIQAALAGLFISATAPARFPHLIIGSLLPWFAIAPAEVAFLNRRRLARWVVTGSIILPVGLWIQGVLGHMPFNVTTAIHVPLGVTLFGWSLVLVFASMRSSEVSGRPNGTTRFRMP